MAPNKNLESLPNGRSDTMRILKPAFHCVQLLQVLANTNRRLIKC